MDRKQLLNFALLGLQAEQGRIMDAIADVREELSQMAKPTKPAPKPQPAPAKKKARRQTAAQKKAASVRMKKYWADLKAVMAKGGKQKKQ